MARGHFSLRHNQFGAQPNVPITASTFTDTPEESSGPKGDTEAEVVSAAVSLVRWSGRSCPHTPGPSLLSGLCAHELGVAGPLPETQAVAVPCPHTSGKDGTRWRAPGWPPVNFNLIDASHRACA